MKKIVLISMMAISMILLVKMVNAQSQRLVFTEEFTQASCGPCAAANPTYNALLAANPTKIAGLKYQTSWPGVDPMNAQNPTQVATRVTYYSVTGVPTSFFDGRYPPNYSGAYQGYPNDITQSEIDSEYTVTSPFTMVLTHSFDAAYDSIYIKCRIKCTQAISVTGPMVCQIAMTEKHIHFTSAPGANGETDFYNVMREMYPSTSGTTMSNTWAVGDSLVINLREKLPTFIYDKEQIAVVSFIQDNATKKVEQAGYSAPIPMSVDAATVALSGVPSMQCTASFTPSVYLKNYGTTTITTATMNYRIDNGTLNTSSWTGSLASGDSVLVTLPTVTSTTGSHTDSVYVTKPNGTTDLNPANNVQVATFNLNLATSGAAIPLTEGFEGSTYPPASWIILNPYNGETWVKASVGGFGNSSHSSYIDFYNITQGVTNDLVIAPVDLSTATVAKMTFSLAHATYTGQTDELQVLVSTDCGSTWNIAYDKSDPALATTAASTSAFTPTSTQWRTDTVNLVAYVGHSKVFVSFHAISGYGNNLYVDDINISKTVGINEISNQVNVLNVYPNPSKGIVYFEGLKSGSLITVTNIYGQTLMNVENVKSIDLSSFANGIYFVKVKSGNDVSTQKIVINK